MESHSFTDAFRLATRSLGAVILIIVFGSCVSGAKHGTATSQKSNSDLTRLAANDRRQRVSQVSYQLEIDLLNATSTAPEAEYSGRQILSFELSRTDRDLRIDFFEGTVSSIEANGKIVSATAKHPYSIEIPADVLRIGRNSVAIAYAQKFSRAGQGLHRFRDPLDGKVYLYSQFETFDANRFMPCFDQPDLRATLTMTVEAPASWTVVTAVKEKSSAPGEKPDSRIWIFPATTTLATYLFSLHAGPYASFSDNSTSVPLRLFVRQSMKELVRKDDWFTFSKQGIHFFEKFFAQKYPFGKLDQLLVPEFNAGGMENAGAITYSEWTLSRAEPTRRMRRSLASLILHEISHLWFGDLVTMAWWNDLWLNESFATYMSALAMAEATEFKEGWQAFAASTKNVAYAQDAMSTTHPIEAEITSVKQAEANFDGITYNKGASVIKQLAFYVTERSFRLGIQDYLKKHRFRNTTLTDFIAAVQLHTKKDLKIWAERWLRQSGTDRISTEWACNGKRLRTIKVNLETPEGRQFRPQSLQLGLYGLNAGVAAVSAKVRVDVEHEGTTVITGDWRCPSFIYANQDDHGYVEVALDSHSIEFVIQNISTITDATTRALVWNDLWRMVRAADLPLKSYVAVLQNGFSAEKDELILQQVQRTLTDGSSSVLKYWPSNERSQAELLRFVAELENKFLERMSRSRSGSDAEKFWYDSLTDIARTKPTLNHLLSLYDKDEVSAAFPLDLDRKWRIANLLSRYEHARAASVLMTMQALDGSDRGVRSALSAQAISPDLKQKTKWIREFQELASKRPLQEMQAVMNSLFPPEQAQHRLSYTSTFFEFFQKHHNSEDQNRTGAFVRGLMPLACEKAPADQLRATLSNFSDTNPTLQKLLLMSLDEDERCQKVRSRSAL